MKYRESKIQAHMINAQIIIHFLSRILFDSIYFTFSNILDYKISRIQNSKIDEISRIKNSSTHDRRTNYYPFLLNSI